MTESPAAPASTGDKSPTVVFVADQNSFGQQQAKLPGYATVALWAPHKVVDSLINRRAAFVFVDARMREWRPLTLACKSNAATRRIPLCIVSDDGPTRADAIDCGADLAMSWTDLGAQLSDIVADYARVPDPDTLAQLACECRDQLPELAEAGLRAFNRRKFYQQHDLFEALWIETAGPVRDLYRAILQVGVAYYQIERGNYRGALKMLQRSVQWLYLLPDVCQGIDVAQLRRDSYHVRAELQRLGPGRLAELDRGLLRELRRQPAQDPST